MANTLQAASGFLGATQSDPSAKAVLARLRIASAGRDVTITAAATVEDLKGAIPYPKATAAAPAAAS